MVEQITPNELPDWYVKMIAPVKSLEEAEKIADGKKGYWVKSNSTLYLEV